MKIVHVIDSLATGGAERFVVNLAICGIQLGHDVSIVLLAEKNGIPHDLALAYKIPIVTSGKSTKDPRHIIRLRKLTKNADIVHVHLFPAFYWAAAISKPKVYTEHSSNNRRREIEKLAFLERLVYSRYNRVIAISEGVQISLGEHLKRIGSQVPTSYATNGINAEFFQVERSYSSMPRRLVIVGSLRPVKQHWLAIKAVALMDDIYLSIAGDGPLRRELECLVDELGIGDRVEFLGDVERIPELLKVSDVLLSTSAYEGLSTVAMEALATGIPVVGPDVPGIRDVVAHGETGVLFTDTEPSAVVDAIRIATHPSNYLRMAKNAREKATVYSIENSFRLQLEVYESILAEEGRSF